MSRAYKVDYEGLWLGGSAIVIDDSEREAVMKVSEHHKTVRFNEVFVEELPSEGVLYNDNGDY